MQAKWDAKKADASEEELAAMSAWEEKKEAWNAMTDDEKAANKEQYRADKKEFM